MCSSHAYEPVGNAAPQTASCASQPLLEGLASLTPVVMASAALQVVVLAGGTNDFRSTTPPLDEWTSDVISFLDMVRLLFHVSHHVASANVMIENPF